MISTPAEILLGANRLTNPRTAEGLHAIKCIVKKGDHTALDPKDLQKLRTSAKKGLSVKFNMFWTKSGTQEQKSSTTKHETPSSTTLPPPSPDEKDGINNYYFHCKELEISSLLKDDNDDDKMVPMKNKGSKDLMIEKEQDKEEEDE
eukprot:9189629-Ditylum_brightwellii.AAC.1